MPIRPSPTITSVLPPSSSSRCADVADHAAPIVAGLIVARLRNLPRQARIKRHRMLGDRALVRAVRAGEPDARPRQRGARILVGARADRLDEGEPRRLGDQLVAPQPGDTTARRPRRSAPADRRACAPRSSRCPCRAARSARPCDTRHGRSRWSACLWQGADAGSLDSGDPRMVAWRTPPARRRFRESDLGLRSAGRVGY